MAVYRRVCDSSHVTCWLTARTGIGFGTLRLLIEYGLPLPFLLETGTKYCDERVRVFVCLSARISQKLACSNFANYTVHTVYTSGRSSVLNNLNTK